MANLFTRLLSRGADRQLREFQQTVDQINDLSDEFGDMSDDELRSMTGELRERYRNGETLDDLLPEAFATVREASERTLGMRHFDVQLIGGITLHKGMILSLIHI